jgi:hypothetical protein
MASAIIEFQVYHQVKVTNQTFGIHKAKLVSSADHVIVPALANSANPGSSIGRLNDGNNGSLSAFYASSRFQVDLDGGTPGESVWFVTRHAGRLNYAVES